MDLVQAPEGLMLRGRLGLNLGLLLVVLVLGTLAYLKPGHQADSIKPWLAVAKDQIGHVVLEHGQKIVFDKKDGVWEMTAPFRAPVNPVRLDQLLEIGMTPSDGEYPLEGRDLKLFGLDQPLATLTLGDTVIQFGGVDPLKRRRYVRSGEMLFLVKDGFSHHLNAAATDYIDKKLLPEVAVPVSIEIPGLKAVLSADGQWTSEQKLDGMDLGDWAMHWSTARAIEVRRMEQPVKGETIRIGLKNQGLVEFTVVSRLPELTLARKDLSLIFVMTTETSRDLLHLPKPESAKGETDLQAPEHDHQGPEP